MYRTNTARDAIASGLVHIDAGEGVTLTIPAVPAESGGGVTADHPMLYDSGWWNITSLIPVAVTSGSLFLARSGGTVWLDFSTLRITDLPTSNFHRWSALLPQGFRPSRNINPAIAPTMSRSALVEGEEFGKMNAPNWAMGPLRVSAAGEVIVYDACDAARTTVYPIQGITSWHTLEAPPATLPGIPA